VDEPPECRGAFTPSTSQTSTRYRCALFREVFPLMVKYVGHDREELLREAEKVLSRTRW